MRMVWEYGDSLPSRHVHFTRMDTRHIRDLKIEKLGWEFDLERQR